MGLLRQSLSRSLNVKEGWDSYSKGKLDFFFFFFLVRTKQNKKFAGHSFKMSQILKLSVGLRAKSGKARVMSEPLAYIQSWK